MDSSQVAKIVASNMSVSDKIRALAAAGYPRAEIARVLAKRYQHVRNVLEADKAHPPRLRRLQAAGFEEAPSQFSGVHRLNVEADGIIRLPPDVQAALGVAAGGVLVAELEQDRLVILSGRAAALKARALVQGLGANPQRILSEELIAERRAEAAREDASG